MSLEYNGPIKAPVQEGEKIANLIIKNKDQVVDTLELYAGESIKKLTSLKFNYLNKLPNLG